MSVYQFVRNQVTGDPFAKAVLIAIAHYANWEYGHCFPSAQTIADDCECGERTVRAKLEYLAEHGFIRLDPRPGKTPMIVIEGYREWFLENEKRAKRTPAAPAYPTQSGRSGNPGSSCRSTPAAYADTPAAHAVTPAAPADELTLTRTLTTKVNTPLSASARDPEPATPATRNNNLDGWEQAPPPPATPIENPSPPWDEPKQGAGGGSGATPAKMVARRVADKSQADTISTREWPKTTREDSPKEFKAWVSWLEENGYVAQAYTANHRGFVLAPEAKPTKKATDLYRRKFPLESAARKCNAA